MVLVYLKNLIFPSSASFKRPSSTRSPSHSPLLPSYSTDDDGRSSRDMKICSRADCPNRPSSGMSNESNDTSITAVGERRSRWLDPRTVSDAIIGLSDGLTVPFALTAGLSAFNNTNVVLYGGFAELIAGSISMGLGGWLAGRGEAEFYNTTLTSTQKLVYSSPDCLPDLIVSVFAPYNIPSAAIAPLIDSLLATPSSAIKFLMCFHHQLPPSNNKRTPLSSALTIAIGYFLGGFIPLWPYFFVGKEEVLKGLYWSVGVMAVCLFLFGVVRTWVVGEDEGGKKGAWGKMRGGLEMVCVGGVAAGASWAIIRALDRGT